MSRFERSKRPEEILSLKSNGGILDLIDNEIKSTFKLTYAEYDYLCEFMSDEEIYNFANLSTLKGISLAKKVLLSIDNHLKNFNSIL